MKRIELLSPVGNMETMYQAIHNGCDAIYLAGTSYGARKFADNFTNEELVDVIKYAHLYGVKVYVTVNTLIYEYELDDCLEYIEFLHRNGVDAVIMQDIGLMKTVREKYPNLEVHASTQCHNYNEDGIKLLKSLGITRVVLAREMSLDEINKIDVDIEKEVFIHGALCVSYSGCCLFSSLNGGRSGNRGECVGSCRLAYKLIKNNEEVNLKDNYLLSTKELNTIKYLDKLIESGIDSLKIEGRMKSPYYVGYVTRLYRTLIDKYYNGEKLVLSDKEIINLKKLYNREFTCGYLFNDSSVMNRKTSNHQGIEIGAVIDSDKRYVKIKLSDYLAQNDGIRFKNSNKGMIVNRLYDRSKLLKNKIDKDNICYLDNKFNVKKGDVLIKTIDSLLIKELEAYSEKKINIDIKVECLLNNKLKIIINDGIDEVVGYGDIIKEAISREVSLDDIVRCVSKLGNTPFKVNDLEIIKDDNIFISLKNLNEIRREVVEKLIGLRKNKKKEVIIREIEDIVEDRLVESKININVLVRNEEQLKCCLDNNIASIYVTDYELYNKYKYLNNIYYRVNRLENSINLVGERLLVPEIGNIYKYVDNNSIVGDYYLNVTNSYSIKYLSSLGLDRVTLSVELDDNKIRDIMKNKYNVELIIYGRLELMLMKYCPLKECLDYCKDCKSSVDKFYLENSEKERYPIIRKNCVTHIMHSKNIDRTSSINNYKDMGIRNYRIELFDESYEKVKKIIKEIEGCANGKEKI